MNLLRVLIRQRQRVDTLEITWETPFILSNDTMGVLLHFRGLPWCYRVNRSSSCRFMVAGCIIHQAKDNACNISGENALL